MHARNHKSAQILSLTTDWLGALSLLIKGLKTCEFDTVDALLAAVANDEPAAGLMLKRVLVWHTSKSGGEFYLSQQDWWRQCRVNRKTVDRVKTKIFPLCGITVEVKATGHGKATHYRLHEAKFLRRLAQVINLPMAFIVNRICPKWTEGYAQKGQMGMSDSDAPLTIESTINTTNDVVKNNVVPSKKIVDFKPPLPDSTPEQLQVIDLLKKANVPGQSAVSFALLPLTIVQDCINSAQSAYSAKRTKNRVGYLIGALRKQRDAFKAQPRTPPPNPSLDGASDARRLPVDEEGEVQPISDSQRDNFATAVPVPTPAGSVNEHLSVIIKGDWTAQELWDATYQQLELQLDHSSFNSYFRHARLVDYEPDCFVVRVPSRHARDMCQHSFIRTAKGILRGVAGRELSIRYECE